MKNIFNLLAGLFIMLVLIPLVCLWWGLAGLGEWLIGRARRFFE